MSRRQHVDRTWIKNHPLEGDGLITGFYNFLHKRNTKTLKPCKDVFIPDTIVFDHNFPRAWYTSDLKAKEISKKQGKELDAASIAGTFSVTANPTVLIVAAYMSSYEVERESGETEMCTDVEFFNEQTLREFVARKTKREGILQRFVLPKGHRNGVIQAVWSPLIFSCKRRTNVGSIADKVQCEKDPYPVAVTYEGPSHFSEEGTCAVETTAQIKDVCKNIVEHFYNTEHKYITRMVLYFKVDERNQLWLLWCGSLRVSDRGNRSQMPVNLAAVFSSPSLQAGSPAQDDAMLHEADMKHLAITHDALFFETYVRHSSPSKDAQSPTRHALATDVRETGGTGGASDAQARENGQRGDDAEAAWFTAPGIQDQHRELCADRDLVLAALEDVFYEAYGHFLRHDPGAYRFEVPRRVAQTLGEELLQELMQQLKIDHIVPSEESADNDELWFAIPPSNRNPVSRIGDEARRWVQRHYGEKEAELRDEAASLPRTGATTTHVQQTTVASDAARNEAHGEGSSDDEGRRASQQSDAPKPTTEHSNTGNTKDEDAEDNARAGSAPPEEEL